MVVQIQESKKLFQWFLGESGQKRVWSFSSWDPKICTSKFMDWADFLHTDYDTISFGTTNIILYIFDF